MTLLETPQKGEARSRVSPEAFVTVVSKPTLTSSLLDLVAVNIILASIQFGGISPGVCARSQKPSAKP